MVRTLELLAIGMVATVALSALLTRVVRDHGVRRGLLDVPNDRSSHVQPTPRTGGVAIAITTTTTWFGCVYVVGGMSPELLVLTIGAVVAALVGFADDLLSLHPGPKFFGLAAIALPAVLLMPHTIPGWPLWMTATASAIWVLGYTNALNFMDGSDGLAAGVVVIVGSALAVMSWVAGDHVLAWFAMATVASSIGFLFFNAPPASVFMGDSGSYFLGFTISAISFLSITSGVRPVAVLLLLHPFLFDTSWTLMHRILRGERFWRAHRKHFYQRLLILGATHKSVALRYYLWQVTAAACALVYQYSDRPARVLAVVVAVAYAATILFSVRRAERARTVRATNLVTGARL